MVRDMQIFCANFSLVERAVSNFSSISATSLWSAFSKAIASLAAMTFSQKDVCAWGNSIEEISLQRISTLADGDTAPLARFTGEIRGLLWWGAGLFTQRPPRAGGPHFPGRVPERLDSSVPLPSLPVVPLAPKFRALVCEFWRPGPDHLG